jgi:transposase
VVRITHDGSDRALSSALSRLRIKAEKVALLPSKAPFSKRFEEAVGQACEAAAAGRVARQFGLAASTVRAIDLRYLQRWAQGRRRPALRQMGVDEIYLGKKQKFLTVVTNLETGEPLWFRRERKKETLDEFFEKHLSGFQRSAIRAANRSGKTWSSGCRNAESCTTSFTFCSMRAKRWTKCGGLSSSAKEARRGIWCGASAGCF